VFPYIYIEIKFGFYKRHGITWSAEGKPASKEELRTIELVN